MFNHLNLNSTKWCLSYFENDRNGQNYKQYTFLKICVPYVLFKCVFTCISNVRIIWAKARENKL